MRNPIFNELIKLRLISKPDLITLSNRTRDRKIKVLQDKKTKIIFLEKYLTNNNYYQNLNYKNDDRKIFVKKNKLATIKTFSGIVKSPTINSDYRRADQFKKILRNKDILDFGCEWGGFLRNIKNYKSLTGVELREVCIKYIKNNIKRINILNDINSSKRKYDVITLFHVLEHMPHQVNALKNLRSKLKKKGKIIIEVPHANDFLILQDELKEFKNFTFWSQHLILHTFKSLETVLIKSGFKNINIEFFQRYDFCNHLGWFLKKKPGGHEFFKDIINENLNKAYRENLKKLGQTDTLIVVAENS
jgi:2-polyprenyl-3-methyl-5-hydroxy-6-metoxy-1,4-benzoquinol methylase